MAAVTSLLLLVAAAGAVHPNAVPLGDGHGLVYEHLTIKRANGDVLMNLAVDGGIDKRLRAAEASTSCRSAKDGDDVLDCRRWPDGRTLRVTELPTGCFFVQASAPAGTIQDCRPIGSANWFGGGEEIPQKWPLEKYDDLTHAMVTMERANRGIQDPFWLTSDGMYIFVAPGSPLFIEINGKDKPGHFCMTAKVEPPYRARNGGFDHNYYVCQKPDAKQAFMHAVEHFLGKPTGHPDERMIKQPVWSTWARYKANIDEVIVKEFATEIKDHGFANSQLEIDDAWETCYGSKIVDTKRFPDMKALTDWLKQQGYRVTIWTHPFINLDCPTHDEAAKLGYLVKNATGTETHWWNGAGAIIDFTNPAAASWFESRHKQLLADTGIDGFKFDAGETSWNPVLSDFNIAAGADEDYPCKATKDYVETCARFNSLTEVRSAYRSQALPVFVRMIDKDSHWGDNNGLKSLVTTLLQMNMVGYSMVLPDMIGGNQYNGEVATQELFIRWLQANTFMPALQYALVPWDFGNKSDQTVTISKKFNALHEQYADVIVAAMRKNIADGTPVNPPIWWLDPTDKKALAEDSEFLLGDTILSAPILEQGAMKRDVYLPKGFWKDGNNGKVYTGPTTIKDYPAPLDTLPWFIRQASAPTTSTARPPSTMAPPSTSKPSAAAALHSSLAVLIAAIAALVRIP